MPSTTAAPGSDHTAGKITLCVGRGKTDACGSSLPRRMAPLDVPRDADADDRPVGRLARLINSFAFRIGMGFWALFVVCLLVAGYIFYTTLEERLLDRIDQSIIDRLENIREVYSTGGVGAVRDIATLREDLPMQSSMGFHLSDRDGSRIAGNVPICLTDLGWDVLDADDIGLHVDGRFRFLTVELGDNLLSLGRSLDSLEQLRSVALHCLLWTLAASMLLAILAALFLARRLRGRVDGLADALDKVAAGDLDTRLPVSRHDDDIDEMAEQINATLERLGETVDGIRQVSSDIAHDLKTPLNRLVIQVEEAADRSRAGDCVGEELDTVLDEARSINGTFEALLRIAQIEAGARRSQFRPIDLAEVLQTVAEIYTPVVEEGGGILATTLSGVRLPMVGDRELLLQLIVNLIENAIHHGGSRTSLCLSGGEDVYGVWLSVSDNGPGIPAAERQNVFRRLYRLQRSRTTQGTGLGLSLVQAIADLHCGLVSLADGDPMPAGGSNASSSATERPGLRVIIRFARTCPIDTLRTV